MKANIHFLTALLLFACGSEPVQTEPRPQAVRAVAVRVGPVVEGRTSLAEVVPAQTVRVLAQVSGSVSRLEVAVGGAVAADAPLVRISAPDVAARSARVGAERARAERERDFVCSQLRTDRVLAETGDISPLQLELGDKGCASAELAVDSARAAEREAGVVGSRAVERAPFAGEVLAHLVDAGQTVMPGTPLLVLGSRARQLRLRLPAGDLEGVALGTRLVSALGTGRVVEIGAQAQGPGRLVEVFADLDEGSSAGLAGLRAGSTTTVSLVLDERQEATAVPLAALREDTAGPYVLVVEDQRLRRVAVVAGPRQDGWVAVDPALPEGSLVVSGDVSNLDPARPVLAVRR